MCLYTSIFGIDLEEVWQTVDHDLPDFKRTLEQLLKDLEEHSDGE